MTERKRSVGGQPRTGQATTRMLRVRMDESEWRDLETLAEESGSSMSDLVRQTVLSASARALASRLRRKKSARP